MDAHFARQQGIEYAQASRFFALPALGLRRLRRVMFEERQDLVYQRYARLHDIHYGRQGRGYQSLNSYTQKEQQQHYDHQFSRLQGFLDEYPDLLLFKDGDSFLDWGCGTGQNIRLLAERYPESLIIGYDLSESAIELIAECEKHPHLQVSVGNLVNDDFRTAALAEGFDHIVLSHVFSLIFGDSRITTQQLRQRVIRDLVQACRSSLIIIDVFGPAGPPTIRIEQRQRAIVWEDILAILNEANGIDGGRPYMISTGHLRAVVFSKNKA